MANINVKWFQASGFVRNGDIYEPSNPGTDLTGKDGRSVLDFGAVQAGKITNIKAIFARFISVGNIDATVTQLQFWLESRVANASGSQNPDLTGSAWAFYYCIVPKNKVNFSIDSSNSSITESAKRGKDTNGNIAYLSPQGADQRYYMVDVPSNSDVVPISQFQPIASGDTSLVLNLNSENSYQADSHYIFLDVSTDRNAQSGNTEGWYYRMNFLYS